MPEIGSTLREARMRARIDITEVEQATKIRAKYLRALENEEWNLLPGATFVKSFLREYADYLDLDSRRLVEEYKLRFERPSEHELAPITPSLGRDRRGGAFGGRGAPRLPRWAITGGLLLLLLVALFAIGSQRDDQPPATSGGVTSARTAPATTPGSPATQPRPATPTRTTVQLVATGTVYVCLVDERGRVLIPGSTFTAGQHVPGARARSMLLTLGNNQVLMRVNGRSVAVPASATAIAYRLTPQGARPLPAGQAPTCT
jgi:cytoskeleton protein RodZ